MLSRVTSARAVARSCAITAATAASIRRGESFRSLDRRTPRILPGPAAPLGLAHRQRRGRVVARLLELPGGEPGQLDVDQAADLLGLLGSLQRGQGGQRGQDLARIGRARAGPGGRSVQAGTAGGPVESQSRSD
jgi:hypothetical protein